MAPAPPHPPAGAAHPATVAPPPPPPTVGLPLPVPPSVPCAGLKGGVFPDHPDPYHVPTPDPPGPCPDGDC